MLALGWHWGVPSMETIKVRDRSRECVCGRQNWCCFPMQSFLVRSMTRAMSRLEPDKIAPLLVRPYTTKQEQHFGPPVAYLRYRQAEDCLNGVSTHGQFLRFRGLALWSIDLSSKNDFSLVEPTSPSERRAPPCETITGEKPPTKVVRWSMVETCPSLTLHPEHASLCAVSQSIHLEGSRPHPSSNGYPYPIYISCMSAATRCTQAPLASCIRRICRRASLNNMSVENLAATAASTTSCYRKDFMP